MVCEIDKPSKILFRLESIKYPKMLSTKFASKRAWNSLVLNKSNESCAEFITRFDALAKQVERHGEILPEKEKIENFLIATEHSFPELTRKNDAMRGDVSLEELKILLLNEESKEKETKLRTNEGQVMNATIQKKKLVKNWRGGRNTFKTRNKYSVKRGKPTCYRCGKFNHSDYSKGCRR